jgi:drug/metabolite transporter (DMT)-like permease
MSRFLGLWTRHGGGNGGFALFLSAILLFSVMDALAKDLTARYEPVQVVWARYAGQTFWAFLLLAPWLGRYLGTDRLWLQLLRSALLFGATFFFFSAFRHLQLAEMTAIFEIAPLVITILSVAILGERVGPRRWLGVGLGLLGALIIIRPGSEVFSPYSLLPALAACCFAGYSIATRFIGPDESPFTSLLYTTLIGTIVASLWVPFHWSTPEGTDIAVMAGFGAIGMAGQLCLILAFTRTEASALAPFSYFGLLFNALWGFVFFAEVPDAFTWTGAAVIVGAGIYVWHRERQAARPVVVP